MANIVIQTTTSEIEKMKTYYQPFLTEKLPPGGIFLAKKNGCTITAYRSGKVMFQGANNEIEASIWGKALPKKTKKALPRQNRSNLLPNNISSLSLIGTDEVGKGDYFGPFTVVAAYVKKEQIPLLQELGVKDSKHLSDPQIVQVAKDLLTFIPYSLLTLSNEKYNELQASGLTQGKMTAILHNQAINHLLGKIAPEKPEAILIDQFTKPDVYYRHLQDQQNIYKENVYFSTQAESIHLAVAAASILARYAFLKAFDELSKKAGFTLTKGAGHKVDREAARIIKEQGINALHSYTKLHFANTEKAKKIAGL